MLIVELRHSLGKLKDKQGNKISIKDELDIIEKVYQHVREDFPKFQLKIIAIGSKLLGSKNFKNLLGSLKELKHYNSNLLVGLDIVDHEDLTHPLLSFVPDLLKHQNDCEDL